MRRALGLLSAVIIVSLGLSGTAAQATFPGQNGRIVFSYWVDEYSSWASRGPFFGYFQLFSINPDGSDPRQLTDLKGHNLRPSFSPDGTRIVFAHFRDGGGPSSLGDEGVGGDIYIVNADGSGLRSLTTTIASESEPAWSPDGKRIAFTRNVRHLDQIFVMRADGSGRARPLTDLSGDTFGLEWSPSGREIAFMLVRRGIKEGEDRAVNLNLYVLAVRTGRIRQLTHGRRRAVVYASWSPDGRRLVFADWKDAIWRRPQRELCYTVRGLWTQTCDVNIYAIDADGTDEVQLTDGPRAETYPSWSPDGKKIVYASDIESLNGMHDVWVMDPDGSNQQMILRNTWESWDLDWGPLP